MSSMMAELVALAEGVATFGSLQELFDCNPIEFMSDSESALQAVQRGHSIATSAYTHAYRLRISALRDLEDLGMVQYQHIGTRHNKSDLMTKVFGRFEYLRLSQLNGVFREDITKAGDYLRKARTIDAEGYVPEEKAAMQQGERQEKAQARHGA